MTIEDGLNPKSVTDKQVSKCKTINGRPVCVITKNMGNYCNE